MLQLKLIVSALVVSAGSFLLSTAAARPRQTQRKRPEMSPSDIQIWRQLEAEMSGKALLIEYCRRRRCARDEGSLTFTLCCASKVIVGSW